jgi:uncharacterized protein involved in exopolysaccharide biosynthesis
MALQQRYTDTHPDVVKAKKDVATLQKRVDESNAAESNAAQASPRNRATPEVRGGEPAGVQQLRAQLHGMELSIRDKERAQAELQRQIKTFESRIQLSPVVEEKHKQLTRDYQTALDFYNQLLGKKNQSEMATDLERRQQGEQFRVLDPPNLPEKPTFPNRRLFAAGGFGGGLALGLVIALLLEYRDKSIRSEQDVQFYLELPTLALMPTVEIDPAHMRDGNWRKRARLKSAPREGVGA